MILSWTDELMRAYDILNSTNDRNLLPLCHSTQNAQITIDINSDGNIPSIGFAEKVEKEDAVTIIPVTEDSSSRGAGMLSATQNAKSGKPRDKPKLSGINQHKADCYAVCCVSQVVYPARYSKVSCQKNRCVFASIFLYLLKRRSVLNNRFKLF